LEVLKKLEVRSWKKKNMYKLFLIFLFTQLAFSQSKQVDLVESIFSATETFSANANPESLKILEQKEKSFQPKTKAEFLAMVYLLCNKSYYFANNNLQQKAISNYEKAWQVYQKNIPNESLKTYDIIEFCLKPLGNLYTQIGDYSNAENIIKQYFYIANTEKNSPHKYAAILNLSIAYQSSGKNQDAINLLKKTIQTEKLTNIQKGILHNSLGNNYLISNDKDSAKKNYIISIEYLKNSSDPKTLSNAYKNLALLNNDITLFQKAKKLFLSNKNNSARDNAKFYKDEATLLFKNNKIDDSQNSIFTVFKILIPNYSQSKSVLPDQNSLYAENTFLDVLDLQAAIFNLKNQPKKALECYLLAFNVSEKLASLLVYENSKIVNQIENRNRTEKCIDIYYKFYLKENNIKYLEAAFLLQEKSKAAVLKSYVYNKKTQTSEEKLITTQLQDWNNIIIKEQQKTNYADISKINEAIKKQNELMLLLKSNEIKKLKESKEFTISDLYSKLEKDKAILQEYFVGENSYYCFTIQNNKIALNKINEVKKESVFNKFIAFFNSSETISNNPNSFNEIATTCYKKLNLPKKSSYKNLIIVPDGILNFMPFEALITKKTSTVNFAKMHYLLHDYVVSYSNSASFYNDQIPFYFDKESVLGIFPVFKNSALELTYSVNEMKAIQKYFNGNYYQNDKATFSNFKENALTYSILHLSTHASSGDIFEPATIKFIDEDVLYSEFYNLNIHPNLVVLSACETGLGKLFKAEGAMSIARGFQFAGAQNLLFSLWKVNDFTTSVIMENFYKNIKNGKSYAVSNHDAKLKFLKDSSIPNAKKSPYYWSAFVYYGTLENNHLTNNYWIWISISIVLFALLFFSFHKSRKRKSLK
jgi:CHAT domain-containing protein/tetratricopeptide (TPR) repeat protein